MGFFRWLEQRVFTGEILEDYGTITEQRMFGATLRTSALLCRKAGELHLVLRHSGKAFLSASVNYTFLPASSIPRLREIIDDVQRRSLAEESAKSEQHFEQDRD
jgi:hypothetical protein